MQKPNGSTYRQRQFKFGMPVHHGNGFRWRKSYRNQAFTSKTYPEISKANEQKALQEFLTFCQKIDGENATGEIHPDRKRFDSIFETQLEFARRTHDDNSLKQLVELRKQVLKTYPDNQLFLWLNQISPVNVKELLQSAVFQDRAETVDRIRQHSNTELSARALADSFLKTVKTKLERNERSRGYYDLMKRSIELFVEFYGPQQSLEELTELHVKKFAEHLDQMVSDGEITKTTANNYQARVRTWISHTAEDYPIPLPKNLRSKKNLIHPDTPKPVALSIQEAKIILVNAKPKTRLYLLLALNCGMLQADLADFQASEIDWANKRIVRCRTKAKRLAASKGNSSPGRCNWLVWRDTWKLLSQFARRDGHVFLQENGNPLVTKSRSDNISPLYNELIAELKLKELLPKTFSKTLKSFRKTGSTEIYGKQKLGDVFERYLNHSFSKRHYVEDGTISVELDKAVKFLGKVLGVD